jgi:hypothetical protein
MIQRLALAAVLALVLAAPAPAQPARGGAPPGLDDAPAAATPTEALFNAINLGDLDQVRAAVAAGADTGRRNVLGLTPLDLAIDLGHAEIAFYLMSLGRTSARPAIAAPPPAAAPAPRPAPPRAAAPRPAPAPTPTGAAPVAPLWQGGGGAPVPEAGFLGFDAGRPEGARQPGRPRG